LHYLEKAQEDEHHRESEARADQTKFNEQAELTKKTCPISVALSGTQINPHAKLVSG
jgi:hypothetical protein